MQPSNILKIKAPAAEKQQQLHMRLGEFARFMQRPKDAHEVQQDTLQPVPPSQLPMVF